DQCLHLRPIVRWCIHSEGKRGGGPMLTCRAAHGFHPMFNHPQAPFWELGDVSPFFDLPGDLSPLSAARFTLLWSMRDDLIGSLHLSERVSGVSWLPSFRLALLRLQMVFQAITRRRLVTVVALFRHPPFQLVIAQQCPHQQPFQFLDPSIFLRDCFFEVAKRLFEVDQLLFQLGVFFFGHALRLSALSSPLRGDLNSYFSSLIFVPLSWVIYPLFPLSPHY